MTSHFFQQNVAYIVVTIFHDYKHFRQSEELLLTSISLTVPLSTPLRAATSIIPPVLLPARIDRLACRHFGKIRIARHDFLRLDE